MKDFGTSFRINIFRKPFETDLFGVVNPVIGSESQSATQSADGTLKDPQSATQDVKPGLNPPDHLREMIRQDPKVTRKRMAAELGISEWFGNRGNKKDFARKQSLKSVLFAIHQ